MILKKITIVATAFLFSFNTQAQQNHQTSLFINLPDYCPTPDGMAIAADGSLTLSCPNYADKAVHGNIVSISKDKKVTLIAEITGANDKGFGSPMGIDYGPDGTLYVCVGQGKDKGRVLKLTIENLKLLKTEVIAEGLQSPNGIRYHDGYVYITQPKLAFLTKDKNVSGVYRFDVTKRNIKINNDTTDKQLIFTTTTQNPDRQFGLDGLAFNSKNELFVGDFGDAIIHKLQLDKNGKVTKHSTFVDLADPSGADGICFDDKDNLYVTGFLTNKIIRVAPDKTTTTIAQFDDNDGSNGQLDQPSEIIVYNNQLVVANFDLMKGKGITNTKHSKPFTLSAIALKK